MSEGRTLETSASLPSYRSNLTLINLFDSKLSCITTSTTRHRSLVSYQSFFIVGKMYCNLCCPLIVFKELKQPRRRRQQLKNVTNLQIWQWNTMVLHAFSAVAFFISGNFADVLVLSTKWNDPFCNSEDDVSPRSWQILNSEALVPVKF